MSISTRWSSHLCKFRTEHMRLPFSSLSWVFLGNVSWYSVSLFSLSFSWPFNLIRLKFVHYIFFSEPIVQLLYRFSDKNLKSISVIQCLPHLFHTFLYAFFGLRIPLFVLFPFRASVCLSFKSRLLYTQFIGTAGLKLVPVPNFISVQATNTKAELRYNQWAPHISGVRTLVAKSELLDSRNAKALEKIIEKAEGNVALLNAPRL